MGPGLIEVLDGLVDREIGAGVAKRAASRGHVGRCRRDRRSRSEDRPDEGVIDLSPAARDCGGRMIIIETFERGGGPRDPPPSEPGVRTEAA